MSRTLARMILGLLLFPGLIWTSALAGGLTEQMILEIEARSQDLEEDNLPKIRKLIEGGAQVGSKDKNGNTPLITAILNNDPELIELLLAKGADVNARGSSDITPLIVACYDGDTQTARILLEKGADLTSATDDGTTCLLMAVDSGSEETAKLLVQKGAPVDAADKAGITPLILAAQQGQMKMVELLLNAKAKVNVKSVTGLTPLIASCFKAGNAGVARLLIQKGADVTAKTPEGGSAWIVASLLGDKEMLDLLKKHGAK